MKRFHVHVAVDDLAQSTRFYSALFGATPAVSKPDYAKWMLDDPRINFAISQRGQSPGINHLGLQVDSDDELAALKHAHDDARLGAIEEGETQCCYAHSNKHWLTDPQGVAWEVYHTMGAVETFNGTVAPSCGRASADATDGAGAGGACCAANATRATTSAAATAPTTAASPSAASRTGAGASCCAPAAAAQASAATGQARDAAHGARAASCCAT